MKEIDKEFIAFLKINNCYFEYKENFINDSYYPKFREFIHFEPRKKYISYAFFGKILHKDMNIGMTYIVNGKNI